MEPRLVPLNVAIGLTVRGDLNAPVLSDAGYQLSGLEVPMQTPAGTVVIDAVIASGATGHILVCEAKSGANVEIEQARRYGQLDPIAIAQSSFITLQAKPYVEPVYVCLAQNTGRIVQGLEEAELACGVLAVGRDRIVLERPELASDALRQVFAEPVQLGAPPPRIVPFDHESPAEQIRRHVQAALVALLARRVPQVSLRALAEEAAPQFGLWNRRVQGSVVRKVGEAARAIANGDPATFEYHPAAANRDGLVRFLRTPEDNDPRGRTQAYQALARGPRRRRRGVAEDPDQLGFDLDLLRGLDGQGTGSDTVSRRKDDGDEEVTHDDAR